MKKTFAVIMACIMALSVFTACSKALDEPVKKTTTTTEPTTEPVKIVNPFTGESDYNESAVDVRPVAIVVENHPQARPQWGIDTPDIIVEGEVEGGISRMLWLYADYTALPDEVGPTRSARPSYVQFASFFDAIFIHWGGSKSKSKQGYTGGYKMIRKLKMDNIDGMKGGKVFGRNRSRSVAVEHTGIVKGNVIPEVIKEKKLRAETDKTKFTEFSFNERVTAPGEMAANRVAIAFSSRTDTRKLSFSEEDKLYHTGDWKGDVKFQNIIVLCPKSTYITVPYKNSHTTYLNYEWSNGAGYYISDGKACEIKWDASKGVIKLTDTAGKELKLNKGRSYIAFSSSNNGGKVTLAKQESNPKA